MAKKNSYQEKEREGRLYLLNIRTFYYPFFINVLRKITLHFIYTSWNQQRFKPLLLFEHMT